IYFYFVPKKALNNSLLYDIIFLIYFLYIICHTAACRLPTDNNRPAVLQRCLFSPQDKRLGVSAEAVHSFQ
ncbi:MAG: hypothetical protein PUC05_04140, partial [Firmicutes bacterium]|nr:hypothetical protein [Bacillota bacterium]